MSYCRFSNNSDVYAYQQDEGVFVIHVAAVVSPELSDEEADKMSAAQLVEFLRANSSPIGGRFDGQTFTADTPAAVFCRLRDLATTGYRVPVHALENLHKDHPELGLAQILGTPDATLSHKPSL